MAPSRDLDSDDSVPLGCPKCNAPMEPNDDLCDACGYHLILKKVIDISDMKKPNKATGFDRVLQSQLHDSESGHNVLLLMKIVAAFMLLAVLFFCLGRWWWIGVLAAAGGAAFYWSVYRKRVAQAGSEDSEVNLDPLSAALWSFLLTSERVLGWRKLEWPFPKAMALTLRDPKFTDEELTELERLGEFEALDFEGAALTNDSVATLRELKRLRFLVVRKTQITPAAAKRLQVDLPNALIWY